MEIQPTKEPQINDVISMDNRGGIWAAVVIAAIGFGIVLSGLLSGTTGFYGDVGDVGLLDRSHELLRELARVSLFTALLLFAVRVKGWKDRKRLGNLLLVLTRCFAIVLLIESARVIQIPHGVGRLITISFVQYAVFSLSVFLFFSCTLIEALRFTTTCVIVLVLLVIGMYVGHWLH